MQPLPQGALQSNRVIEWEMTIEGNKRHEKGYRVLPVLHPVTPLLIKWVSKDLIPILLDPSNAPHAETSSTILSRTNPNHVTGPLPLREESEHLQTQHVKNRATLVLSHCHLQYHAVPYLPRQLSPVRPQPLVCPHVTNSLASWLYSCFLLRISWIPQLSQFRLLWNDVIKEQLLTFYWTFLLCTRFANKVLNGLSLTTTEQAPVMSAGSVSSR